MKNSHAIISYRSVDCLMLLFIYRHAYIAAAGLTEELESRTQSRQQQAQQQQIQKQQQAQQQQIQKPEQVQQQFTKSGNETHPKVEKAQNGFKTMPIPTIQHQQHQHQIPSAAYGGKSQGQARWEDIPQETGNQYQWTNAKYNNQPRNHNYRQSQRQTHRQPFYMNRKVDNRYKLDNRNKKPRK